MGKQLAPFGEQFASVLARIDELERRVRNQIRAGRVVAISGDGKQIQVRTGKNTTPFISWLAWAMGEVREYRCPSEGEQVLLLNYGGGLELSQCWALCGVPSSEFQLPASDPKIHRIQYADGSFIEKNDSSGDLAFHVEGDLILDVKGKIVETATQHVATKR